MTFNASKQAEDDSAIQWGDDAFSSLFILDVAT